MTDKHYTPEEVAKDCLDLLPIKYTDIVVDAGSGIKKVWYDNLKVKTKYEYEIEEGNDFLKHTDPVDWVVGNPPFSLGWEFLHHSSRIARKGIAFLGSYKNINSNLLPTRLKKMEDAGFGITRIHVMTISKWYGRYFFIVYEMGKPSIVSYTLKNYKEIKP